MQYTRPAWAARISFHPLSRIIFFSGTRSPAPHHATTTTSGSSHKTACAERCAPDSPRNSPDRKSTRLNSSHEWISYAVFCLKKKKNELERKSHEDASDDRDSCAVDPH